MIGKVVSVAGSRLALSLPHLVTRLLYRLRSSLPGGWLGLPLLLGLLLTKPLYADTALDTLVRGNQLYEQGDFQGATQLYEQLITQGVQDSVLFYNLGNAYYKQGDLGRARLNYERAARLAPRDDDIRTNLELARSQVSDQYDAGSGSPLAGWLVWVQGWLTQAEVAWLALFFWGMSALCWISDRRRLPSPLASVVRVGLSASLLLLIVSGVTLGGGLYRDARQPPTIVLAPELKVASGPGAQYATEFTLHSGAQVALLETRGDWVRIALPGEQLQGWVPGEAVATIVQ